MENFRYYLKSVTASAARLITSWTKQSLRKILWFIKMLWLELQLIGEDIIDEVKRR